MELYCLPNSQIRLNVAQPLRDERAGFLGAIVRFDDHSSWKLERAVSKVKYQQGEPPYEGTQVFVATCIRDPRDTHSGIRDAIVKVKFQ
jgi:hypothetical protein